MEWELSSIDDKGDGGHVLDLIAVNRILQIEGEEEVMAGTAPTVRDTPIRGGNTLSPGSAMPPHPSLTCAQYHVL